jgi:hypothetical protein
MELIVNSLTQNHRWKCERRKQAQINEVFSFAAAAPVATTSTNCTMQYGQALPCNFLMAVAVVFRFKVIEKFLA